MLQVLESWVEQITNKVDILESTAQVYELARLASLHLIEDCTMFSDGFAVSGDPVSTLRKLANRIVNEAKESIETIYIWPRKNAIILHKIRPYGDIDAREKEFESELVAVHSKRWLLHSRDFRRHGEKWKHLIDKQCGAIYLNLLATSPKRGKPGPEPTPWAKYKSELDTIRKAAWEMWIKSNCPSPRADEAEAIRTTFKLDKDTFDDHIRVVYKQLMGKGYKVHLSNDGQRLAQEIKKADKLKSTTCRAIRSSKE
jgi:hypothetical protein